MLKLKMMFVQKNNYIANLLSGADMVNGSI